MNSGKCPKCQRVLKHVQFEEIQVFDGKGLFDSRISLFCPKCHTILSVGLNTDSLAVEILFSVKKLLKMKH